jgi:acyl carrier protein
MIFFKRYFAEKKIKSELKNWAHANLKVDSKPHSKLHSKKSDQVKKTDLDSVQLIELLQFIEKRWGHIELFDLYQAETFDQLAKIIAHKKN